MLLYTIVSIICIVGMTALVAYLIIKLLGYNRTEKIEFIKSFKKGKCVIIYLFAIPLYFFSNLYVGKDVGRAIFDAITSTINLVILKYDYSSVLLSANVYYAVALYLCFVLVTVNAMMITLSVLHQSIWCKHMLSRFKKQSKEKCIIIGNNEKSRLIYETCNAEKIIVDVLSKTEQEKLYIRKIAYKTCENESRLKTWLNNEIKEALIGCLKNDKKLNIIINNDSEQVDLKWCGYFIDFINNLEEKYTTVFDIFVFGDREFEDIYARYEEKSKGCLHYINEYQQKAVDFIDKYPLTEFMNEDQIDYNTSLVYPETDINVVMIGFGKTNQQIMLSMIANNHFLTTDPDGKIIEKKVNYHLFDKSHTEDHKSLNHNYFRYKHTFFDGDEIKADKGQYLPLPELPSREYYHYSDINDISFYNDLNLTLSTNKKSLNYIIVSLGLDYSNIDMTNKIWTKLKEWNIENTHIFVRIRDKRIFNDSNIFLDTERCHPFGNEKDTVCDYSHIIQEKFTEMSIMRNYIYDIEHDMNHEHISEKEKKDSKIRWFLQKSSVERESNVYALLSLRSKLHLMGLDYCKKDVGEKIGLTREEYLNLYATDDMPTIVTDDKNGVAVKYSLEYKKSRRKNMAMQEHCRWNAYMIMKGFIPSTKKEILEEENDGKKTNGKNYAMRRHGNLTTFDGLIQFRKMLAERDSLPEEKYDVIKYDYQLLDGAWWLLDQNNYKIIKKDN